MKRIEILNIYRTLGRVKLNKVADKELRNALISDHLRMFRVAKDNDDYVASLREQFDPQAVKELNEAYQQYAQETVDVNFILVSREAFGDALAAGDVDFTLGEMALLDPIFKD